METSSNAVASTSSQTTAVVATPTMIGESQPFQTMRRRLSLVAEAQRTTLISGPTGSGKELVARALHGESRRCKKPYVTVHCATLPDTLVEAEMFGHHRGAFTGATQSRPGLIRSAASGTLFLDEVDSLPGSAQAKLLRFLETGEYRAVGSDRVEHSGAWIIAATNQKLEDCVSRGTFRADLMYRLSVVRMDVPPLTERQDDVLLLAEHFLRAASGGTKRLAEDARAALVAYHWPGNVRELKHCIEAGALFHPSDGITAAALGFNTENLDETRDCESSLGQVSDLFASVPLERALWSLIERDGLTLTEALSRCEGLLLHAALEAEGMNRTRAASRLGIHVRTIFKKLAR